MCHREKVESNAKPVELRVAALSEVWSARIIMDIWNQMPEDFDWDEISGIFEYGDECGNG